MEIGSYDPHDDMVTMSDGTILPRKLAQRGEAGWDGEEDRDSAQAAKLAELVRDMDGSVTAWLADSSASVEEAERIMGLWVDIRKITQGRDITEDGQP